MFVFVVILGIAVAALIVWGIVWLALRNKDKEEARPRDDLLPPDE